MLNGYGRIDKCLRACDIAASDAPIVDIRDLTTCRTVGAWLLVWCLWSRPGSKSMAIESKGRPVAIRIPGPRRPGRHLVAVLVSGQPEQANFWVAWSPRRSTIVISLRNSKVEAFRRNHCNDPSAPTAEGQLEGYWLLGYQQQAAAAGDSVQAVRLTE